MAMMMTRMAATTGTIRFRCDRMILSVCSVVSEPPPTSRAGAIVPEMQAAVTIQSGDVEDVRQNVNEILK